MIARALGLLILVAASVVSVPARAAPFNLMSDAFGSAGGISTNGSNHLGLTAGQSVIGVGTTSHYAELVGFWRWGHLPVLDVKRPVDEPPTQFALLPGAPNPFRTRTAVSYAIPGSEGPVPVSLRVYDLAGRLIRDLDRGVHAPGRYVATWDGRDETGSLRQGGVYFCRLNAGRFQATRRLLLIR
jgi:hypothetical protein